MNNNKLTPQQRGDIDRCQSCDHNGLVEILPPDKNHHTTLARCPHSAMRIIEIKRDVEAQRAAAAARYAHKLPVPQERPPT